MSADTLRRAAALMRERAEAATARSPWASSPVVLMGEDGIQEGLATVIAMDEPTDDGSVISLTEAMMPSDAEHIASWHPAVALAVAAWLDNVAEAWRFSTAAPGSAVKALTVARTYLNEEESP